jgi:cobalamin biosynthesis protein CobT
MPEEDDDALGQMLGDRIKGSKDDDEDEEQGDAAKASSEAEAESVSGSDISEATSQENTRSAQITQSTDTASAEDEEGEESELDSETEGSVRSRSPFPLYVTPELKETVQNRFEKFNAQRTLNDEAQVEKHKHFMEGLLRAGLDHPDLEEYVLDEFTDDE